MNRPEPKVGDPLIDRGYRTVIDGFDEEYGTRLRSGGFVCISEFEKNPEGTWLRKGGRLPELEMPVGEDGPQQLADAESRLRQNPLRYTTDPQLAELLADVLNRQAWMGNLSIDMLNRTGGPETVRLARYINEIGSRAS